MSFYPPPLFRAQVESKQCNAIVNCSLPEFPIAAAKQKTCLEQYDKNCRQADTFVL